MKQKTTPTLTLEITKQNYDRAVQASSGSCLVADAIKEQYPNFSNVKVDVATIRFSDTKRGERFIYLTSPRVAETLLAFDQGWPEEKFPIQLRIRTPLKVVPMARSVSDVKSKAEYRAKRLVELKAKAQSGQELTREEKGTLTRLENRKESVSRPSSYGSPEAEIKKGHEAIIRGGRPTPLVKSNPNLLHGYDRHFGGRSAQPSEVMKRALKDAEKVGAARERAKRKKG